MIGEVESQLSEHPVVTEDQFSIRSFQNKVVAFDRLIDRGFKDKLARHSQMKPEPGHHAKAVFPQKYAQITIIILIIFYILN